MDESRAIAPVANEKVAVDAIIVGDRIRRDLGDPDPLAESMGSDREAHGDKWLQLRRAAPSAAQRRRKQLHLVQANAAQPALAQEFLARGENTTGRILLASVPQHLLSTELLERFPELMPAIAAPAAVSKPRSARPFALAAKYEAARSRHLLRRQFLAIQDDAFDITAVKPRIIRTAVEPADLPFPRDFARRLLAWAGELVESLGG